MKESDFRILTSLGAAISGLFLVGIGCATIMVCGVILHQKTVVLFAAVALLAAVAASLTGWFSQQILYAAAYQEEQGVTARAMTRRGNNALSIAFWLFVLAFLAMIAGVGLLGLAI